MIRLPLPTYWKKKIYACAFFITLALSIQTAGAEATVPSNQSSNNTVPGATSMMDNQKVVGVTSLEALLGWSPDSKAENLCKGYYVDQPIVFPASISAQSYLIRADQSTLYRDKPSIYLGHVSVTQPHSQLLANKVIVYHSDQAHKVSHIEAFGDVELHQPGVLVVANQGKMNMENKKIHLDQCAYRLLRSQGTRTEITKNGETLFQVKGLSARGTADEADRTAPNIYEFQKATYSTCVPSSNTWNLHASHLHIDNTTKNIKATNVIMTWHDVPFMYLPYFTFSYDHTRKSGLLYPIISSSSSTGFEFGIPYYFNLAPNYDMVFTPIYMTKRGFQLNDVFRYLTWNTLGQLSLSALPGDRAFENFQQSAPLNYPGNPGLPRLENDVTWRGYLSWQQQTFLNQYWNALFDMNYVTDDYYFQDFADDTNAATQGQLPQQAQIQYQGQHSNFLAELLNYQTLHPVNTASGFTDQYAHWPQLDYNIFYPNTDAGLSYSANLDYTLFHQPIINDHFPVATDLASVYGNRININPTISWDKRAAWGYVSSSLQVDNTDYLLYDWLNPNLVQPSLQQNNQVRTLPLFDVDSGLYFDRSLNFFGSHYTQTLEPRLFYLYVPYQNQNNLPIFDSSQELFTYDSIFRTNRFDGLDRIGDANQIGLGLTSRFFDQYSGVAKMDASVGELFYFSDRRVGLFTSQLPNQQTQSVFTTSPNNLTLLSPVAAQINYYLIPKWTITGDIAWDPNYNEIADGRVNFGFSADPEHVFNIGYSYQRYDAMDLNNIAGNSTDNINQLTSSLAWPLIWDWHVFGAMNYNIAQEYTQNYIGGLEYDACCWAFRVIASRQFLYLNTNNRPQYDNSYYIQFLFRGIGALSNNSSPGSLLQGNIPGYIDSFKTT